MVFDWSEIRMNSVSIAEYMNSLEEPFKEGFFRRKQTYQPRQEAINKFRVFAGEYMIIAFSAAWCKDCAVNIPVLAIINEASGLEVRVFGGLKKDLLGQEHKWRIPPSPPEVETFNVDKTPLIMVVDKEGRERGRIVEKPAHHPTLEQELCEMIKPEQRLPPSQSSSSYFK